jgi:hypothetical protein
MVRGDRVSSFQRREHLVKNSPDTPCMSAEAAYTHVRGGPTQLAELLDEKHAGSRFRCADSRAHSGETAARDENIRSVTNGQIDGELYVFHGRMVLLVCLFSEGRRLCKDRSN